jgi:hypothetical protein
MLPRPKATPQWCNRLSTLRRAEVITASTNDLTHGWSINCDVEGVSVFRNRHISMAWMSNSIQACPKQRLILGATSFEMSHLRMILYARMQLRTPGGSNRYRAFCASSEINKEGSISCISSESPPAPRMNQRLEIRTSQCDQTFELREGRQ